MKGRARAVVALVLLTASSGLADGPPRPDILLVTVDTLRADHVGLYGYRRATTPRIDEWFGPAHAAVYERSYSTAASTPGSTVSILSGLYPPRHGVRLFYQRLDSNIALLPEMLPPSYDTAAFVSNVVLTDGALGLGRSFGHYDDFVDERESTRKNIFERRARRTTDAALRWLSNAPDDQPVFLWVHYIDPHGPYRPPADRPTKFQHDTPAIIDPSRVPEYTREPGANDGHAYIDRYDEEIAYADAQVGRLLDGYTRLRDVARSVLVFTADHGETMMERSNWFTHGYHVYEELVRVPLMIRAPGVKPGHYPDLVSAVDIVPTVLEIAGAQAPGSLDGVSLLAKRPVSERLVWSEAPAKRCHRAVISTTGKWVVSTSDSEPPSRSYFDLAIDPEELTPLPWPDPSSDGARLITSMIASDPAPGCVPVEYTKGATLTAPRVAHLVSEADRERLRALGYMD